MKSISRLLASASLLAALGHPVARAQVMEQVSSADARIAVSGSKENWVKAPVAPKGAPNVVVILLDDVGFAAGSTFGGAVPTPGMDRVAADGLRYNNFHVTALCSPTRAALLTGRNDHRVGFGTVTESSSPYPGYDGVLRDNAATFARVLKGNGYSTAAIGKWHNTPYFEVNPAGPFDRWPTGVGFDYFYGFMAGAMDHFSPYLFRNTTAVEQPRSAEQGFNLAADLTDDAIRWVDTHNALSPEKPYLLYYATGATHEPHQPPRDWIARFKGRFDQGWDKFRSETFARQKKLGFIPAHAKLTPRPAELPAWDTLSADQKRVYARQMEVFAAFLAYTDHEVDRLLRHVRAQPGGDNTLVVYVVSDNGASAEGGPDGRDISGADGRAAPIAERVARLDELGQPQHPAQYSAGWAWATSSPFQWTKQVASHLGGATSPLIISWPERIKDKGGLREQFTHVNSIAATLYEVIGITPPTEVNGVKQLPLDGVSFAYSFTQPKAPSRHGVQIFEQMGNRAIYKDGWWAGALHSVPWNYQRSEDFSADRWELYNLSKDYSQATDLAMKHPEKLREMQALFDREAKANNVYPLNNSFGKNGFGGEQPRLLDGRKDFVFRPGFPGMPAAQAPDFSLSHRIAARIMVEDRSPEGVLLANGGNQGGFLLYVQDGHVVFENNYRGGAHRQKLISTRALPKGMVDVVYEYDADPKAREQGEARILINGELAGNARITHFSPPTFTSEYDTLTIGRAPNAKIGETIAGPSEFSGTLESVRVSLK
ncbi:arylsulfatase [Sphingomonas sp. C3-2]|uniref:arylsulfatase n=1 Tax=Sphingomonas sp. C3-2 TaxID=3062169 RepID=UPI00294B6078|nr:arylsulfatase [Sphingomonas sp. C3-2]WOK37525.1 arylsulfatase [Sphingomonas sp. C3-2]